MTGLLSSTTTSCHHPPDRDHAAIVLSQFTTSTDGHQRGLVTLYTLLALWWASSRLIQGTPVLLPINHRQQTSLLGDIPHLHSSLVDNNHHLHCTVLLTIFTARTLVFSTILTACTIPQVLWTIFTTCIPVLLTLFTARTLL
jgi:hypothetical protein